MVILKKMSHTTDDQVPHPDAVWRLVGLHVTTDGATLVFYGYHNQAAYEAGAQPIMGAVKEYTLPAGVISDYPELESGIHQAAWAVAAATLEGVPPAEGEDTRVSFFAGA
jgi:hypothetical protein